ncbi:MAG: hypothetical protein V4461_13650 [Pseudomonadota bacterium]|jgi:hypothetical protein|uniref:hypothetical protein n=1 Tax=unclassified Sphingobium TaxID=2611147 RepID=UPI001E32FEA4|nr:MULTISPECIES: hypothetical protein [unclassified Sphingobium]GLI97580.1 hypothetical protein Sbs19_13980 [Sphingobium sp. BS19]CAH0350217.1 hypothetical protein SPH9361_00998 [Sphingobium sp. CECT 9361]|tara:strand:+ start:6853 stop:7155 length:303 start_codon:yes stop_codon:yes gene_type:complete
MFDAILGNLEPIAAKIGLPPEQVKGISDMLGAKIGGGADYASALTQTANEYGLPVAKLEEMLAAAGGPEAIMGKLTSFLDRDGDGNPLNELSGLAKGLFG